MTVKIQAIQFSASHRLTEFIEKKIAKLEHFFNQIIRAEVYLTLDNKGSNMKDKVAKVKINLPGIQIVASETSKIFEEAVDLAIESIKRQIKRHKEKLQAK